MNKNLIIGGIVAVFLLLVIGGTWISAHNGEIEKRNKVEAQQKTCEANFDKMFKSIAQVAEVTKENMKQSKQAFKDIYPELMEGRYSNERGGALMSWVAESNPQFDLNATSSLYKKLANTIEANRDAYFLEQKKLISFKEEYDTYISKFPNSIFVGGEDIEITVITSEKTEQVYEEAQENDIKIFED